MFGIFKKTSKREQLEKQYQRLLKESYELSHTNRKASDDKALEADKLRQEIDQLPK